MNIQSNRPTGVTDPEGPTGKLASWLAGLDGSDVPTEVRTRATYVMLDGFSCAIVGARLPWSQKAADVVIGIEPKGAVPVIGHGISLSPVAAALLNGTFIQAFELDDYHALAPLHSNSLVLPALLSALAFRPDISGRDVLTAAIAGYETGPRVGLALGGLHMLSRGWHSGAVFGTHSAAAAAGRIYGLDAGAFEDALGIAGTQSSGLMAAQFGAMVKRMHHGMSARSGYLAAALAAGGYTGIKRVFEQDYGGYLATFGEGHDPDAEQVAHRLGDLWETDRISIKPYAAMGGHHSSIDAILKLRADHDLTPDIVERIEVGLGHAVFHHGYWEAERPLTETGAQMHVGYSVTVALIDGAASAAQYAPQRIDREDIWDMLPRVHVYHDPSIDKVEGAGRLRSNTKVILKDGRTLTCEISAPTGHFMRPMSNAAIEAKYLELTDGLLASDRQQALMEAVLSLDTAANAKRLTAILADPVSSLFEMG